MTIPSSFIYTSKAIVDILRKPLLQEPFLRVLCLCELPQPGLPSLAEALYL